MNRVDKHEDILLIRMSTSCTRVIVVTLEK